MENADLKEENILFTGGSGLLGSEMKKLFPRSVFPTHSEFDVTSVDNVKNYYSSLGNKIKLIVHCAAIKTPPKIEKDPILALKTNILGTANLVELCSSNQIKLVYISSDYVFKGTKGNYNEEDAPNPINKYGYSKLGGECAVRMYDNSLIVRMSFFPNVFPYDNAFVDQFISRLPVTEAAEILGKIILSDLKGVIHLAGKSQSTYEFALSTSYGKEIKPINMKDIKAIAPRNVTIDNRKLVGFLGYSP